jgi:O-antigen ligase
VRGVGNRLILMMGGAVFATALFFSYSRSSVINVALALGALVILERSRAAVRRAAVLMVAALAAVVAILFRLFPAYAELYWVRLWASVSSAVAPNEALLSGRVESWRTLGQFLLDHPWHAILGVGYKTLPYSDFIGRPVVADNMYLSILVETGIVGLIALLTLNFAILREGYRAARSEDSEKSFYGAWIFCFWAGQTVQMLSVDLLTFWRVMPVYLWVLAMAVRR